MLLAEEYDDLILNDKLQLGQFIHVDRLEVNAVAARGVSSSQETPVCGNARGFYPHGGANGTKREWNRQQLVPHNILDC
jgi:hypothetical protein